MTNSEPLILVIDSSYVARNSIKMLLEPFGKVMFADDCSSADRLVAMNPTLVVLEYSDKNREEADTFIRRHPLKRTLLFSSVNLDSKQTANLGVLGIIEKPAVGELRKRVADALAETQSPRATRISIKFE